MKQQQSYGYGSTDGNEEDEADEAFAKMKPSERDEARAADRLSMRLLAVADDNEEESEKILRESLRLIQADDDDITETEASLLSSAESKMNRNVYVSSRSSRKYRSMLDGVAEDAEHKSQKRLFCSLFVAFLIFIGLVMLVIYAGVKLAGPPRQPVGAYRLVERQEGHDFFRYYNFYEGRDSVGSNGYNYYVGMKRAQHLGIVNVSLEKDVLDVYMMRKRRSRRIASTKGDQDDDASHNSTKLENSKDEPFVYMSSSPTKSGPRDSIRLEGIRRFDRGLFVYVHTYSMAPNTN